MKYVFNIIESSMWGFAEKKLFFLDVNMIDSAIISSALTDICVFVFVFGMIHLCSNAENYNDSLRIQVYDICRSMHG